MQHGVCYSILLALPYFDPTRFTAIDSMHNLFLGTGNHIFCVLAGTGRHDFRHLFHLVMVHSQLVSGKIGSLSILLYF